MTISRNISVLAQGASSSGILAGGYGGLGASVAPTTAGNVLFTADGSVWSSTQKIVQASVQTPRSVSAASFTGIPSWVKRITMVLNGISTNGTTSPIVQIGSGGYSTSGYVGNVIFAQQAGATTGAVGSTSGFTVAGLSVSTASISAVCNLVNMTGNVWAFTSIANRENGTTAQMGYQSSVYTPFTLSGVLDRVQLSVGADLFDAGTVNILYE